MKNKRNTLPNPRKRVLAYFTTIFLIMIIFSISATIVILTKSRNAQLEEYKKLSSSQIEIQKRLLQNHFEFINSDLVFLPHLNEIIRYKETAEEDDLMDINNEFLEFIKGKLLYDQLRYINHNGMELARVNLNNGNPEIVLQKDLQNKVERYYFTESMKMPDGGIYISPFDLNVEHSEIEIPLKPMIRFGTPVYDTDGSNKGVIILNYLGDTILEDLREATTTYPGVFSLLNSDGYWLYNDNPDNEWGFMFPEKTELNFQALYPELWKDIQSNDKYQNFNGEFLFTSVGVKLIPEDNNHRFIIINTISTEDMKIGRNDLYTSLIRILSMITIIIAIISLILSRAIEQRNRYRNELKRLALYDNLTGLPNRRLLAERGEQIRSRAIRYSHNYAVFFLDLDGFKKINDSLGHEAGDILLKDVATILLSSIRSSDTAARVGGDEFIILLSQIKEKQDCALVAEKILKKLSSEFLINGEKAHIGGSIGIIAPPQDLNLPFEELLRKADAAMYEVKKTGKNNYLIIES